MDYYIGVLRYVLPLFAAFILIRCVVSLVRNRPRAHRLAQLVNTLEKQTIEIDHWETSIGRSKSCDISLDFATVSRFHGVLSKRKYGWVIADTYSKTGILINGEKIHGRALVYDGDTLLFGTVPMVFCCEDAPPPETETKPAARKKAAPPLPQAQVSMPLLVDVQTKERYEIPGYDNSIGRSPDADIFLTDDSVSESHARLRKTSRGWAVSDVYSTSGVRLNGRPVYEPQLLFDGDRITLGDVTLLFMEQ